MNPTEVHLELDVLDRLAAGALDERTRASAQAHLDACAACRARRAELAENLALAAQLRSTQAFDEAPTERLPDAWGGYRFVREIGRGGMGIVYEAEQHSPQRRVAIKVLGAGFLAGAEVERMLRREAQALARLEHPSVARIYDLGRLPDGRPFLVMELVDGVALGKYATEHALAREARLRLFAELCDAVAYAHQRGVIHRDLKPSNVLVDASGRPRVLDFGLARLVDVEGEASVSQSIDSGRIRGTLAFMSPEQARGDEAQVDARSDVYSLGVILYALLLGRQPYEIPTGNLPEAVRVICEHAPARPGELDRALRGDLETILRRALEKEPRERYATVAALRDDVLRFLERQPILARAPSLVYQLGKLVQRHTWFFASIAAAFVAAIAVGIWTSALYRDADAQRALATRTAHEKEAEASHAQSMVELLERMLGSASVHEAKGADYTVRALLDDFGGDFGARLSDQPDVEARLRSTMARAYLSLGLGAAARQQVDVALALRRAASEPDAAKIFELRELHALCAHEDAQYEDAEREFRALLEERERTAGPNDAAVAHLRFWVGDVLRHRGDFDGAEELARSALATWQALGRDVDADRLSTLSLLGQLLEDRGAYADAKAQMQTALDLSVRIHGERNRNSATLMNNLGTIELALGETEAAEAHFQRSLDLQRELVRGDHPEVARVLGNLGELRRNQGKFPEAVQLLQQCLEMRERVLPAGHPDLAQTWNNLALARYGANELDTAVECMRKAVAIRRAPSFGADPKLSLALLNLASLLRTRGDIDEAVELCREGLALDEARLPPDHVDLAYTLLVCGRTLREKGELDEAVALLRRALEIRVKLLGDGHAKVAECQLHLGTALRARKDFAAAETMLRASAATTAAQFGPTHAGTLGARVELGNCLRELARYDEAEVELLAVHQAFTQRYGAEHARTKAVARSLATLYAAQDRSADAERWQAAGAK